MTANAMCTITFNIPDHLSTVPAHTTRPAAQPPRWTPQTCGVFFSSGALVGARQGHRGMTPAQVRHECRSVNRNCCLGIWNLYFVFLMSLSISKSQGEVRNLDSAWRYLDLEICPGSRIRGEARNLDSGWPELVFWKLSSTSPKSGARRGQGRGIWNLDDETPEPVLRSWKLFKYSQNAPPSFPALCLRFPRCF